MLSDAAQLFALISRADSRQRKPRITGYVEQVVGLYSNNDFRDMFRLPKTAYAMLLKLVSQSVAAHQTSHLRGKVAIPLDKQQLIMLFYMGTTNTERQIADKFGVLESSVWRIVHKLTDVIVDDLQTVFIRWPTAQSVMDQYLALGRSEELMAL